ncbi:hypothetical protein PIB30_047511 [Stylosanthes scabra]|uniref:Uncharacterized protein n=1 Tax=Stylosanthes scabra TaxID=79078 RepID=A0ABU6WF27_9FABA|nr:hypothetical protein [Stylosanthes scabra]
MFQMEVVTSSLAARLRPLKDRAVIIVSTFCILVENGRGYALSSTGSGLKLGGGSLGTLIAAPGRGRGRGRGPQPPMMGDHGDGQQEFLAAMTNMANTIQEGIAAANAAHAAAAAAGGGGGPAEDRPMTLASFLKINPPTFQGTTNPTDADDWISAIERALLAQ